MSSREEFEAWASKQKLGLTYGDCGYVFSSTEMAWRAWQAMEAKCAALAAELNAVEAIHDDAVFITDDHYEQCPPEVQKIIRSLAVMQIPAYKAFLAEVRAQGVEMFADFWEENCRHNDTFIGGEAKKFAAQLRQGGAV
ncbi:hypothetical protein [Leclercia adecarboxylata]|uniref:hypothetical protein n=1 Tax=Leclercia adecarboxylata TaxID=83655 RepID=UPI00254A27AE|nr:hypothetical protein [Leclercia adecarboxylata]